MEAVIYGGGLLGTILVPHLVRTGYQVRIIDGDAVFLESVANQPDVQTVLITDPLMQDYLQEAGIDIAELFVAISQDDQRNALVAQAAKHLYNVPSVICRLDKPQMQRLYSNLGMQVVGSSVLDLSVDIQQAIGK